MTGEKNNRGSRRECSYVEGRTTLSEHYTRQSVYYTFSFLISSIKLLYILKLDILVFAGPRGFDIFGAVDRILYSGMHSLCVRVG